MTENNKFTDEKADEMFFARVMTFVPGPDKNWGRIIGMSDVVEQDDVESLAIDVAWQSFKAFAKEKEFNNPFVDRDEFAEQAVVEYLGKGLDEASERLGIEIKQDGTVISTNE
jgi:hypothetical protein